MNDREVKEIARDAGRADPEVGVDLGVQLRQLEADIKALLVKRLGVKGADQGVVEARKIIDAEMAQLRLDRKLTLEIALELAPPQEVPLDATSRRSSFRDDRENLFGGPVLPISDVFGASVLPTSGANGTPEISAVFEPRPPVVERKFKPATIPAELPWLEVNAGFDLELYFERFGRVARGHGIEMHEWPRMLSVRIRNDALASAYDKEMVQRGSSWSEAKKWWAMRVPRSESADIYLRSFLDCKQGQVDINSHVVEFDLRAARAKMHQDSNLARLFVNSLNQALQEEVRRTRLREELDSQRGGGALPEMTLQQAQAMARAVAAALTQKSGYSRAERSVQPGGTAERFARERSVQPGGTAERSRVVCSFCSRQGHEERECRKKKEQNVLIRSTPTTVNNNDRQNGYSRGFTGSSGTHRGDAKPPQASHFGRGDDKKREFNGSCNHCKEFGHKAVDCKRKDASGSSTKSFMLQSFGSVATGPETKVDSKALTTAICRYRNQGVVHSGLFALDSCCNANIFAPGHSDVVSGSKSVLVQSFGGQRALLGPCATMSLVNSRGGDVVIYGRDATDATHLPNGCIAMLSRNTMVELGVAVEMHMASPGSYLQVRETHVPVVADIECAKEEDYVHTSFIAEIKVREYLNRESNLSDATNTRSDPLDEIRICETLSAGTKERLRSILSHYRDLFVPKGELPPKIGGGPHRILLKEGAKTVCCPQVKFTPAKAEFISRWVEKSLASGLYELAPESCKYASRIHLASKEGPAGRERELFEIRVTGDYVAVNEQIDKIPSLCPSLHDQTERFNDCKFFFETDGSSCYHQCELDADSRDILAVRTPQGFLIRPCRLMEGMKNSGSVLQGRISRILSSISPEVRRNLTNYMDDINGGTQSEDDLVILVEGTLRACSEGQFSLTARKTKIGFPTANFAGFEVGMGCRRLAEKHCAPLMQMREPTNSSELRSVMGLFVQNREFIPGYSTIAKPLNKLTGSNSSWKFGSVERSAFTRLKEACCARTSLANPDYKLPFHLDVDASDVGYGFKLFQVDEAEVEHPVLYGSKCWANNKEACRPIYHREACVVFRSESLPLLHRVEFLSNYRAYRPRTFAVGFTFSQRTSYAVVDSRASRHGNSHQVQARRVELSSRRPVAKPDCTAKTCVNLRCALLFSSDARFARAFLARFRSGLGFCRR